MCAAERPEREGERGKEAVEQRQRQVVDMQRRRERQRQDRAEDLGDQKWQRRAEYKAGQGADQRQRHYLREVDREHAAAGGAQRLHGGDGVALTVEMAPDGVRHADAADQQRGETDQREILGEALDVALERGRRVVAAADLPAGVRQLRRCGVGNTGHRWVVGIIVGQAEPVVPAQETARLNEPGGVQRLLCDHQARAEADAARELVGLDHQRGADLEDGIADADTSAGLQIEPRQQRGFGDRAVDAVALRECGGKRTRRVEHNVSVQRIGGVDRLRLHQCRAAVFSPRHGAHGGDSGDAARCVEEAPLVSVGFTLAQRERKVSAEDGAAFAREPVGKTRRERIDAGDRHHAERDAGNEHVEAAQSAAQIAQREAQRQREGRRSNGRRGECH